MSKTTLRNLVAYAIAAVIVCYAARGVSWRQVTDATAHATIWLFICASIGGFVCWFIGETFLYSRLFSFFHGRTESRELVPTMATFYFLQIVNSLVASSAFVLFLHARKRVAWLAAGCTLLFEAYVDVMVLAAWSLVAIALVPTSPIRPGLIYAAGAFGAGCFIASFWLLWGARLAQGNPFRWIYDRPSMSSFRRASPSQFLTLSTIRLATYLSAGLAVYLQFVSFKIHVPLVQALALTPLIVAIGNAPFSPGGIGTTQLVFTLGFASFAGKSDLFALSLAVSAFNLLIRIPMGLAMGASVVEETLDVSSDFIAQRKVGAA